MIVFYLLLFQNDVILRMDKAKRNAWMQNAANMIIAKH